MLTVPLELAGSLISARTVPDQDDAEVRFALRLDDPDRNLAILLHNYTGKRVRLVLVEADE